MDNTLKPIETHYNGYRFRSRREARWKIFSDYMGFMWEYEPEGYEFEYLGKRFKYLPDFYDPQNKVWIEVKGTYPTEEDMNKMEGFCESRKEIREGEERFRVLYTPIPYRFPDKLIPCLIYMNQKDIPGPIMFVDEGTNMVSKFVRGFWASGQSNWTLENLNKASAKARSARFEHGEKG